MIHLPLKFEAVIVLFSQLVRLVSCCAIGDIRDVQHV